MPPLDIGIVGCGTAGGAAALFLARAGHAVTLYERVPDPGAVGAGIILQPTGMSVLARLGLYEAVVARGARVDRLHAKNAKQRTVVDLSYARAGRNLFGLGLHRGVLFDALYTAVQREPRVKLVLGCEIRSAAEADEQITLTGADGTKFGPHELLVIADGAQSSLRAATGIAAKVSKYPWGALWFVARDPENIFRGTLHQVVDGPSRLLGLLPTGFGPDRASNIPLVSIFWSMRGDRVDAWRANGFADWKSAIEKYDPRAVPLLTQIEAPERVLYSSYYDVVLKRPNLGRIVFLGDAAHAMSPQLGQGCNLALIDAMTLASALEDTGDVRGALAEYARRRKHHLAYYQFATRWLTPLFQSDYDALGFLRDTTMGLLCKLWPFEQAMLYSMAGVKRGILRPSLPLPVSPDTTLSGGPG